MEKSICACVMRESAIAGWGRTGPAFTADCLQLSHRRSCRCCIAASCTLFDISVHLNQFSHFYAHSFLPVCLLINCIAAVVAEHCGRIPEDILVVATRRDTRCLLSLTQARASIAPFICGAVPRCWVNQLYIVSLHKLERHGDL